MAGLAVAANSEGWRSRPHLRMLVTLRRLGARIAMARVQAASSRSALYRRARRQQAQAGAVALLGMRAVLELPGHHRGGAHADALAPGDELGRRPLQVRAVRRRHVLGRRW